MIGVMIGTSAVGIVVGAYVGMITAQQVTHAVLVWRMRRELARELAVA